MTRDKFSGVSLTGIPLSLFLKYYNLVREDSENVAAFYINTSNIRALGVDLKREPFYVITDVTSYNYGDIISSSDYRYPAKTLEKHMTFMREIYEGILSKNNVYDMFARKDFNKNNLNINNYYLVLDNNTTSYKILSLIPYKDSESVYITNDPDKTSNVKIDNENPNLTFNVENNKKEILEFIKNNKNTADPDNKINIINDDIYVSDINDFIKVIGEMSYYKNEKKELYHAEEVQELNLKNLTQVIVTDVEDSEGQYYVISKQKHNNKGVEHLPIMYKLATVLSMQTSASQIRYVARNKYSSDGQVTCTIPCLYSDSKSHFTFTIKEKKDNNLDIRYIEIIFDKNNDSVKSYYFPTTKEAMIAIENGSKVDRSLLQEIKIYKSNSDFKVHVQVLVNSGDTIYEKGDTTITQNTTVYDEELKEENEKYILQLKGTPISIFLKEPDDLEFNYGYIDENVSKLEVNKIISIKGFDKDFSLQNNGISRSNNQSKSFQNIYAILDNVDNNRIYESTYISQDCSLYSSDNDPKTYNSPYDNVSISEDAIVYIPNNATKKVIFTETRNDLNMSKSNYVIIKEINKNYIQQDYSYKPFGNLVDGVEITTLAEIKQYFIDQKAIISFSGFIKKVILPETYNATLAKNTSNVLSKILQSPSGQLSAGDISLNTISTGFDSVLAIANSFQKVISKSLGTYGENGKFFGEKKSKMNNNKIILAKTPKNKNNYQNIYDNDTFRTKMDEYEQSLDNISDNRDLIKRLEEAAQFPNSEKYVQYERARLISQAVSQLAEEASIKPDSNSQMKHIFIANQKKQIQQYYSRPLSYYKYCNFDRIAQPNSIIESLKSVLDNVVDFDKDPVDGYNNISGNTVSKITQTLAYKNIQSYMRTTYTNIYSNNSSPSYVVENNSEKKILSAQSNYGEILSYIDSILNVGTDIINTAGETTDYTWEEVQ